MLGLTLYPMFQHVGKHGQVYTVEVLNCNLALNGLSIMLPMEVGVEFFSLSRFEGILYMEKLPPLC